jgi:glycine betaine/choline ABC-type transport system substrate-binding protein
LGQITNLLTQEAMVELNRRVAVEADRPGDVARSFLIRNGVISGWPGTGDE